MQAEKLYKLIENHSSLNEETAKELEILLSKIPSFQIGWMLYLKNLKAISSGDFDKVLKKVAVIVPVRKQLYKFLNADGIKLRNKPDTDIVERIPNYRLDEHFQTNSGDSLIDKFLSADNDKLIRMDSENIQAVEGKKNVEAENADLVDEELITETLANIYFQQKKYEKALNAFKKLSLKYPEKSVYFASRINEIEKLKNI